MFKRINAQVGISFKYTQEEEKLLCRVKFHDLTGTAPLPTASQAPERSWFGWKRAQPVANGDSTSLMLASAQFFGYVAENTKLDLWPGDDTPEDSVALVESTPFAASHPRKVIAGRVGGIPHLESSDEVIKPDDMYFVADLVLPFNSRDPQEPPEKHRDTTYKELCEAVLPFHYTPQELLFTQRELGDAGEHSVTFDLDKIWPPSYTPPRGWCSIHYTVAVSFQSSQKHQYTCYFPVELRNPRVGGDPRWLQPIGFAPAYELKESETKETQHSHEKFLSDLEVLKTSDYYTLNPRKKSFCAPEPEEVPQGLAPQLPAHFKTSYQLRVNAEPLCEVQLTRPYYHLGDDVGFKIDMDTANSVKVVGYMVSLECQESFGPHLHSYPVSSTIKTNTMAMALSGGSGLVSHGSINIPGYITHQFQSQLVNVQYYLVFKFNMVDLVEEPDPHDIEGNDLKFRLKVCILP
ncbi:hypothetical protein DICA0_E19460 [Diutina catenulata]